MRFSLGLLSLLLVSLPGVALAQDLTPPPPMDPNAPNAEPQPGQQSTPAAQQESAQLQNEEKEDNGRPLEWVWLNAEAGGSYINMTSFNDSSMALQKTADGGPMLGFGGGIRILILTIGVRARAHELSAFNLWQLDGEVGLHFPIKSVDIYLSGHGGYDFVGRLSANSLSTATGASSPDVAIHGFNAGLSFGGDYYFSALLSLGLDITADALFLKRPPVPFPAGTTPAQQQALLATSAQAAQLYQNSGDSAGFGLFGSLHLGVHF